jgi:hypothetical protein
MQRKKLYAEVAKINGTIKYFERERDSTLL